MSRLLLCPCSLAQFTGSYPMWLLQASSQVFAQYQSVVGSSLQGVESTSDSTQDRPRDEANASLHSSLQSQGQLAAGLIVFNVSANLISCPTASPSPPFTTNQQAAFTDYFQLTCPAQVNGKIQEVGTQSFHGPLVNKFWCPRATLRVASNAVP